MTTNLPRRWQLLEMLLCWHGVTEALPAGQSYRSRQQHQLEQLLQALGG